MNNNFFSKKENIIQNKFLKKGFLVFNIQEKKRLLYIKNKTIFFAKKWIKKNLNSKIKDRLDLNFIHKIVPTKQLNSFRVYIFQNLSRDKYFNQNYYFIGKKYLDILCGNELVMQKNINLSIQYVNDDSSLLPIHADVYQGDSPYELVLWIPLVDCNKTKSMYILPKNINDKKFLKIKKFKSTDHIFKKFKNNLKWLNIKFGQGLIFTQNTLHGNIINKETTTRWSFNCRFKSLLSPYDQKTIGDFFIPITIKPATKLGINYVEPKFK